MPKTDLNALFLQAEEARAAYANDDDGAVSVNRFVKTCKDFCQAALASREPRYEGARAFLLELVGAVDQLEVDDDAPGVWRLWQNVKGKIAAYDARNRAPSPPAFSIDALIGQGVSRVQIAKIYGFYDEDGRPDVARVDARGEWAPPSLRAKVVPIDSDESDAPFDAPPSPDDVSAEEASAEEDNLDAEIMRGVPFRRLAAKYGLSVEAVKERAAELGAPKQR